MNIAYSSLMFYQGFVILAAMIIKVSTQTSCICVPLNQCASHNNPIKKDYIYNEQIAKLQCDRTKELSVSCDVLYVDAANDYNSTFNSSGIEILTEVCKKPTTNEFSSLALLRYSGTEKESNCGGSLITDNYVLTTAKCVNGFKEQKLIKVRLGEENYGIDRVTLHNASDVALIKLDRSVDVKGIQPICLPLNKSTLEWKSKFIITHWKKSDHGFRPTKTQRRKKNCEGVKGEHEWSFTGNYGAAIEAKRSKRSYVQYGIFNSNNYISLLNVMTWITNHIAA